MEASGHGFLDRFGFQTVRKIDTRNDGNNRIRPTDHQNALPGNLAVAGSIDEFDQIAEAQKNILIYFWQPTRKLSSLIAETPFSALPELEMSFKASDFEAVLRSPLDPLAGMILEEIRPYAMRVSEVAAAKAIRLTIGKLSARMCPLFHVDRVLLRLICTLRGPGTEWIDDAQVQRQFLGSGSNQAVVPATATVYQLGALQLGVLKGEKFKGARRRGVVHRSPAVDPASPGRWYLRMDMQ